MWLSQTLYRLSGNASQLSLSIRQPSLHRVASLAIEGMPSHKILQEVDMLTGGQLQLFIAVVGVRDVVTDGMGFWVLPEGTGELAWKDRSTEFRQVLGGTSGYMEK